MFCPGNHQIRATKESGMAAGYHVKWFQSGDYTASHFRISQLMKRMLNVKM
jgi:hypothetical protein